MSFQHSGLNPDDTLRLLQFSQMLLSNLSHFETAVLNGLKRFFGYSITTYTIFDDDNKGRRYVKEIHSEYFPERMLQIYKKQLFQEDPGFKQRERIRANSTSFVTIREYDEHSQNVFEQLMIEYGLQYQMLVGANVTANCPIHCCCIYKSQDAYPPDEYERSLVDAIGQVFSEVVGTYKKYKKLQQHSIMNKRYMDTEKIAGAVYIPQHGALSHTRLFAEYVNYLSDDQSTSPQNFVNDILSRIDESKNAVPQKEDVRTMEIKDCMIIVRSGRDTFEGDPVFYYCITISKRHQSQSVLSSKPAIKKIYLAHQLTVREAEIAALLEAGLSNQEISDTLVISMATVKTHVQNIYFKFEVNSRKAFLLAVQE